MRAVHGHDLQLHPPPRLPTSSLSVLAISQRSTQRNSRRNITEHYTPSPASLSFNLRLPTAGLNLADSVIQYTILTLISP